MPFITEELWEVTANREGLLALAPWPLKQVEPTPEQLAMLAATTGPTDALVSPAWVLPIFDHADFTDPAAEAEIGWVIDLVTQIRSVRAEMNIPPATLTALVLAGASAKTRSARRAGPTSSSAWPGCRTFPSQNVRLTARFSSWCAVRWLRCR